MQIVYKFFGNVTIFKWVIQLGLINQNLYKCASFLADYENIGYRRRRVYRLFYC